MYQAAQTRYKDMKYNRVGTSGLKLPAVSLGFWHNFGSTAPYENMKNLCFTAFDNGITHFDLAKMCIRDRNSSFSRTNNKNDNR